MGCRTGAASFAGGLTQGKRIKSFMTQGCKEKSCNKQRSDMRVVLFGLHEHGKIHREINWEEKLTQVKVSSIFLLRERNPLVLILQNSLQ